MTPKQHDFTAFIGYRRLVSGSLPQVALAAFRTLATDLNSAILVFKDDTGQQVDLDLHGTEADVVSRHALPQTPDTASGVPTELAPRRRGRPRLGVVAREVTLLPDHWNWLASQPGGISVTLRKLVHQAKKFSAGKKPGSRDRTYAFMSAIAGNLPDFEEAIRALFAGDAEKLSASIADWPEDVRQHIERLAHPGSDERLLR